MACSLSDILLLKWLLLLLENCQIGVLIRSWKFGKFESILHFKIRHFVFFEVVSELVFLKYSVVDLFQELFQIIYLRKMCRIYNKHAIFIVCIIKIFFEILSFEGRRNIVVVIKDSIFKHQLLLSRRNVLEVTIHIWLLCVDWVSKTIQNFFSIISFYIKKLKYNIK